jgi:hypothetical protein
MSDILTCTLPIYQNIKGKNTLMGLNWYRNAHYHVLNKIKKLYSEEIFLKLRRNRKVFERYCVEYHLYHQNSSCDLMNVVSVIDKFFQDALQELKIVSNDNVKHCCNVSSRVIEQDKINPRIEIIVRSI